MTRAVVAIVGRPNVGKSTLFNRIVGERLAITEAVGGTTRDRIYASAEWSGRRFSLVDTGGLDAIPKRQASETEAAVRRQAEAAIDEADVIVFLVDAQAGLVPVEHEVADRLRRSGKPVVLVANKAEGWRFEAQAAEFHALGLGEVHTASALQGIGTGDLLDAVIARVPPERAEGEAEGARVAIIGRPNVGKSSFLNTLVGSERAVVSEEPGTTRDVVDTAIERDGERIVLIDTAGIRRRGRVQEGIEHFAVLRTVRAIERADVAILLTDATEGVTAQDVHIAGYAIDAAVGLVLAVNKWDAVARGADEIARTEAEIAREFHFAPWLGHRFVSAKSGRNVEETLVDAVRVAKTRERHVPTADLHRLLVDAVAAHPPPAHRGRPVRFHHVTQARASAPTFVFFVDHPAAVHFSYARYLENQIRQRYEYQGTPVRLEFKGAHE